MKTPLRFAALTILILVTAACQDPVSDADLTARINAFVDEWHQDAAHARPAYFDTIAPDGIYIGTDKS